MGRTLRLIDASDALTVARYGEALDQYNQTGSPSALAGIRGMFQQDSVTLIERETAAGAGGSVLPEMGPGSQSVRSRPSPAPAQGPHADFSGPTGWEASAGSGWRSGGFQPIT